MFYLYEDWWCHTVLFEILTFLVFFLQVQASSVITLLQSDIKLALKTAFGSLDGPLSVIDWCRGCNHFGDSGTPGDGNECKDSSGVFSLVREPISPSQSTSGSSSTRGTLHSAMSTLIRLHKHVNWLESVTIERARIDESSQRRLNQEMFTAESDQQKGFARGRPTIMVLPLPALLVGYAVWLYIPNDFTLSKYVMNPFRKTYPFISQVPGWLVEDISKFTASVGEGSFRALCFTKTSMSVVATLKFSCIEICLLLVNVFCWLSLSCVNVVGCRLLQVTYYALCPDIELLTSAAVDFFQQLGTGKLSMSCTFLFSYNMIIWCTYLFSYNMIIWRVHRSSFPFHFIMMHNILVWDKTFTVFGN